MSRFKLFLATSAVVVPALFLSGCTQRHETDTRTETPLVRLASVEPASGSDRAFTGTVVARVQSNLGFRVPGKITARLVDTGQIVRAGQPLMRIDRTDYTHAITAQTESVAAAKARATQTAADEARYRGLVATGAVSASIYDQMKAAADAARDQLAAVEAQARVATDEGDYTTLCADSDGVVIETLAEPGQVVTAGQTVIKLAHAGPREASISLPETLDRPKLGSVAQAALYSRPGERYPVKLRQLSDAADPSTRTFEARYVLSGDAARAPLGETVTLTISGDMPESVVLVPLGAIDDEGKGPGVWILDRKTSKVSYHPVRVIALGTETSEIAGVRVGEEVVAMGGHYLHEGEQVGLADEKVVME